MRLQLTSTALCLCLLAPLAHAQEVEQVRSTESKLRVYADDDHVTVVSPSVVTQFTLGDSLAANVGVTVDVVSAASVDVITQASPTEVREVRVEGSADLEWSLSSTRRVRMGSIVSHESDYDAFRPSIGGQIEVAERNATLDFLYTAAFDQIGNSANPAFSKSRRGHILAASYSQILDPKTYLDLLGEFRRFQGYHANPYLLVPIGDANTPEITFVEGHTPRTRRSMAVRVGGRRGLGEASNWFLRGSYRLYSDDWSITSHTLSSTLLHSISNGRYLVGLHVRGYQQSSANFYQRYYETSGSDDIPIHRTRNRTLGGMRSLHTSLTLDSALTSDSDAWRLRTMISGTQFFFRNYAPQKTRLATTLGISLLTPL